MLYTFAFFHPPTPTLQTCLEQIPGIQGSLRVYATESLAAAVEPLGDLEELRRSDHVLLTSALRHDDVIQALFAQTPLLPVRFGTCFPSLDQLLGYLKEQSPSLLEKLRVLGHRAEYILKIHVDPLPVGTDELPRSGTDYLLSRQQHYRTYQSAQQQRQDEHAALLALWPPEWPQQSLSPLEQEWGRYTFLLSEEQAAVAQSLTEEWQQQHPHWHLHWTPPLPPYHWLNP